MENVDAAALAQQALKAGLLTAEQIEEAWGALGAKGGEPEPFLRFHERKGYLTPWQTGKLLKGDTEGYVLGGYRILYKIASGSFGRVYRADDPRTGNVVAVKVLRRTKASKSPRFIELFEREGKLGMSLRHPNVVEILAVNRDPATDQHYLVMEFVEGGNLRQILTARKRLEAAEALRFVEEAASGLAYAYSRGLTHRDMKLTNILISSQGAAKLVDFGLAGAGDHSEMRDDDLQVDRTVDYAGLERATGAPEGDVRTDIYFLGCVLYELLTGVSPLEMTKNAKARMRRERFTAVRPLTAADCGGSAAVVRLVNSMMAFQPGDRYQTPSQLLEAIREVRRELEGRAAPTKASPSSQSVFIVESDERLQDAVRGKLKEMGYRVLMSADPVRALERYRQQPYDALIVDAGTCGEEACMILERVLADAERQGRSLAGIAILSEGQEDWSRHVTERERVAVMVRPVTMKQLYLKLDEFMGKKHS